MHFSCCSSVPVLNYNSNHRTVHRVKTRTKLSNPLLGAHSVSQNMTPAGIQTVVGENKQQEEWEISLRRESEEVPKEILRKICYMCSMKTYSTGSEHGQSWKSVCHLSVISHMQSRPCNITHELTQWWSASQLMTIAQGYGCSCSHHLLMKSRTGKKKVNPLAS